MSTHAPSQVERLKRRTERILLRVPIEVKGTAAGGKPFREKTHTVAINRDGARIVLNHSVQPEARLTVTNFQNEMVCPFRVVGRVGESSGGHAEWGVECLEPDRNFWGIFFPPKADMPAEEELIDALLECSSCHFRELAQLTLEDYQTMTSRATLRRACTACGKSTEWTFGFVEGDREEAFGGPAASSAQAAAQGAERRRAKRVAVKLPVRIRLEEVGQTENLSHSGVCFSSQLTLRVGDVVMVTVGYAPGGGNKEIPARVVWRQPLEGTTRALYGVQLEDTD
jgi:hypothetical protein